MTLEQPCSNEYLIQHAQRLKVCGHPLRLRLLCAISQSGETCVSELWECVRQPQPVVSQHLSILKDRGIVDSEIQGNRRVYSIVDPFIDKLVKRIIAEQPSETV